MLHSTSLLLCYVQVGGGREKERRQKGHLFFLLGDTHTYKYIRTYHLKFSCNDVFEITLK